jgi:putative transposase
LSKTASLLQGVNFQLPLGGHFYTAGNNSISRRGNCHDNAVAESFFQLLKRERIKRRVYSNRDDARRDIFDYIEMFYNVKRRHGFNDQLSPVEYEKRFEKAATECLVN